MVKTIRTMIVKNWAVILIVFAWLLFSYPYFFQRLVPFPSRYLVDFFPPWSYEYGHPVKNGAMPDIITQIYPWKQLVIDSWRGGYVPRWNPYQFAGNPHLANVQSGALSPFNILFFILPFIDAWSVMILLQPLLAGIFTYMYARSIAISKSGSAVASLSFMFCGFIVTWMAYGTLAYAALFLPLLLYGIERAYRADKTHIVASIVIIAGSIVLSLFSGHFQTTLYVFGAGILYAIWLFIVHYRNHDMRMHRYVLVIAGYAGGLLLSLPQILPSIHFYAQSLRSGLFGKGGEVIPVQYLITRIAPDFFGNPVTRNDWFGHYAEWSGFAGVVPLVLALISVFGYRSGKRTGFFIFLVCLSMVFAYSTTMNNVLISLHIPVLSTSAASRIIFLSSFSIAILAGYGLDRVHHYWLNAKDSIRTIHLSRIVPILVILLLFVWGVILIGNIFFMSEATTDQLSVARRNFLLPSMIVLGTLVCIGYAPSIHRRFNNRFMGRYLFPVCTVVLIAVTAFDMLRFATKWMPFDERAFVYPETGVLSYLKKNSGYHRVFSNFKNPAFGTSRLYGLEGYDPLYITRYGELVSYSADGIAREPERSVVQISVNGMHTQRLFDMTGVKYIAHAKGDGRNVWAFPYWEYPDHYGDAVFSDDYYEVYENRNVFPRAYLVYRYAVVPDDAELLDRVFDESVDLKTTVFLEKEPSVPSSDCAAFDPTHVDILKYQPTVVLMRVKAPCDGLLVLSDAFYPAWEGYVNQVKKEILRANYAFRAIEVPKGESDVTFIYEDWYR